jgi:hypothetical protein
MPMVKEVLRCGRCATVIRNGRPLCPSCGNEIPENAANLPPPEPEAPRRRKALCEATGASVYEDELVEFNGMRVCQEFFQQMQSKQQGRGGGEG